MSGIKSPKKTSVITVYHGRKLWSAGAVIMAPAIEYQLARRRAFKEARSFARGLLELLTDYSNPSLLNLAMYQAQVSGKQNPFVSTSPSRDIARSFALSRGTPGYIVTIQVPIDEFYDFNKVRSTYGIPQRPEFEWLEELGIPLQIASPFEIIRVDRVTGVVEHKTTIYKKKK
ncbi:MAG: hypothetical protein AABO57_11950 [Acidobacteriota bacterium]